ncbi:hydroxysqualene dehydroxylase HpnE [Flexivirga oryzae]|uniref:Squalene-associated FAD-dependent desaturase n=1 Tax=Flexivirga oryzae TaxID=1794944 RepID=A0A839N7E3_9MICO|nr:hydroxysqualene dehydroxylase HpnE [Flexivirga oryzae]MBB2893680.1 squalene-associated FAD-dependent desaturase [Flexivirga oryzae]
MTGRAQVRVCVVGGGLAGITAALELADAGCEVTLLESRARLGGLTHSFRRGDLWVDGGQHAFLRCCTDYLGLLDRLGVRHLTYLQDRLDVPIASEASATRTHLRRNDLPAPLHLSGSLLRHRWMPLRQRLLVGRIALALGRIDPDDPTVDEQTFGGWLRSKGADNRSIEVLWELIGKATLNADADHCSLALAATVFQLGMLQDKGASDLGWARVPLQQLHGDAAERALAAAGCTVRLRGKVSAIVPGDSGVEVTTATDTQRYDALVSAVPPAALERLLDPAVLGLPSDIAARLGLSPIINVHLVLDRPVMDTDFVAAVDSPLQWVFDRTAAAGLQEGQYVAVSISAADDLIGLTNAELRDWAMPHLRALLPGLAEAEVRDFFVTREPEATFRAAPGSARWRPGARTAWPRLALAGAWTATGWPATMEGAVRSGHSAAQVVLDGHFHPAITTEGPRMSTPQHSPSPRTADSELGRAQELTRTLVNPALHKAVDTLDGQERLVVAYHLGFVDTHGNPVAEDGGKKLRPTLALLGAAALGVEPAHVVSAAAAVELVHNFSLVHDDIMDRDRTRRHRETVWSVWDDATAILAGDALQTLAFETMLADPSPHAAAAAHLLATTTRELIHGQMLDMDFETRSHVSLAECRTMAAAKTGVLLSCSAELPAVLTGAGRERRAALAAYGRGVGAAFQLVDDLLGIWGDPETTGKSNHSDLLAKKRSLPISWALEQPGSDPIAQWFSSGETTDSELRRIATELDNLGARDWCRSSADQAVEGAISALHGVDFDPAAVAGLTEMAHYVAGREV